MMEDNRQQILSCWSTLIDTSAVRREKQIQGSGLSLGCGSARRPSGGRKNDARFWQWGPVRGMHLARDCRDGSISGRSRDRDIATFTSLRRACELPD